MFSVWPLIWPSIQVGVALHVRVAVALVGRDLEADGNEGFVWESPVSYLLAYV